MTIRHYAKEITRFGSLTKVIENADGTLTVCGKASTEQRDMDGELITADCMRAAGGAYMEWGAVREMHGKNAAGTALSYEVNKAGETDFECLVVDDAAIKKVKTGTYKGFSIGGKVTSRDPVDKTIITGLNLIEISLVDRPSNPGASITLVKMAGADAPAGSVSKMGRPKIRTTARVAKTADVVEEPTTEEAPPAEVPAEAPPAETPATETPAEPAPASEKAADAVAKSLYDVTDLAYVLCGLRSVALNSVFEAEWEGDNSPLPAKLLALVNQLGDVLVEMTIEEVAELMSDMPKVGADVVEMFAGVDVAKIAAELELQKKGAKFSKATRDKLAAAHVAMKAANDHLDGLQYDSAAEADDSESEKAATVAIAKAATLEAERAELIDKAATAEASVAKMVVERDAAVVRANTAEANLKKFGDQLGEATKELVAKGTLRVVGKVDDTPATRAEPASPNGRTPVAEKVAGAERDPEAGSRAIRDIHKAGGVPFAGR